MKLDYLYTKTAENWVSDMDAEQVRDEFDAALERATGYDGDLDAFFDQGCCFVESAMRQSCADLKALMERYAELAREER